VLGSISTAPLLLREPARTVAAEGLTDAAIGKAVEQVRDELGELTNLFGRPGYKKQLANVLVRRALTALREQ
jgi:CO/xanthine dehydrogenase FAD-binding subunit